AHHGARQRQPERGGAHPRRPSELAQADARAMEVLVDAMRTPERCTTLVQLHRGGAAPRGSAPSSETLNGPRFVRFPCARRLASELLSSSDLDGALMGRVSVNRVIRGENHGEGLGGSGGDRVVSAGGPGDRVRDVELDSVLPGGRHCGRGRILGEGGRLIYSLL